MREAVERASRSGVSGTDGQMDAVHHETNSPWPTRVAADGPRSYRSPCADDNLWPDSVTAELFGAILSAWRGAAPS